MEYGRLTKKGNSKWSPSSILQILQNERHCGDIIARKTWTPNYLDHKSKKNRNDRNTSFSIQLKTELFTKIRNQPDLLFINCSEDGCIFGCYCREPCRRPDHWVEDEDHKLFLFNKIAFTL